MRWKPRGMKNLSREGCLGMSNLYTRNVTIAQKSTLLWTSILLVGLVAAVTIVTAAVGVIG